MAMNVSEGGLRLRGHVGCRVGERVAVTLPRGEGTVETRVARVERDEIGLVFLAEPATIALARRIVARLIGTHALAA
jgi:hypothetical protein